MSRMKRAKYNIKLNLKGTGRKDVDWIHLVKDVVRLRALVNTAINQSFYVKLQGPSETLQFLIFTFSGRCVSASNVVCRYTRIYIFNREFFSLTDIIKPVEVSRVLMLFSSQYCSRCLLSLNLFSIRSYLLVNAFLLSSVLTSG